jgi:hypothetical protein
MILDKQRKRVYISVSHLFGGVLYEKRCFAAVFAQDVTETPLFSGKTVRMG